MNHPTSAHSHPATFILRLWREDEGAARPWRGQVQLIPDGRIHYFCDWNTLARLLEALPTTPALEAGLQTPLEQSVPSNPTAGEP